MSTRRVPPSDTNVRSRSDRASPTESSSSRQLLPLRGSQDHGPPTTNRFHRDVAKFSLGFILHSAGSQIDGVGDEPVTAARDRRAVASSRWNGQEHNGVVKRDTPHTRSWTKAQTVGVSINTTDTTAPVARSSTAGKKKKNVVNANTTNTAASAKRPRTNDEKRLARKCTVADCVNYTINKGLCFRHGGGKQCSLDGCNASAKVGGLCWKHGGSIQCVVDGCNRRGKSRGFCWTHGGGTECGHPDCTKVAVSKGFCWAHGGGKRCLFDGCQRPAYERTFNYCPKHFKRFENGDEVMEV